MIDFFHLPSSCSTAVKAALEITGEPYATKGVDMTAKSDAFMKANPLGKVPAVIRDGQSMFEGGAINLWLAARHPESGLMPDLGSPEGAEALKWLFFVYATIHPAWVMVFFPQRFAGEDAKDVAQNIGIENLTKLYAQIDEQLAKHAYVAGDALSLADLYLAATIHWEKGLPTPLTDTYPRLAIHRDLVISRPEVKAAFAGEFGYPA